MKIEFTNTLRDRPIVLTHHQIDELERHGITDAERRVTELAGQHHPCKSLGQLMRRLRELLATVDEGGA